jgi:hypothetical protein
MERIISQSMQQYTGTENETIPRRQSQPLKERPPLSSFHR